MCRSISTNRVCIFNFEEQSVHVQSVFSRAKQSCPNSAAPKQEQAAAAIGVRVAVFIKQKLDVTIGKTTFCSDSTTTLEWIYNSNERHKIYLANRVAEIFETSSPSDWRHFPGVLNPTDDGRRWPKLKEFKPECCWFNGPPFLKHDPTKWPPKNLCFGSFSGSLKSKPATHWSQNAFRFEKFKRVFAFVIIFISNPKRTARSFHLTNKTVGMSKMYLLRHSQNLSLEEELDCLRKDKSVPEHSKIKNFLPYF